MARKQTAVDVLAPSARLVAKIGSILVHVEEGSEAGGHAYDWTAARSLLADREVRDWIEGLRKMSLVPVKRHG